LAAVVWGGMAANLGKINKTSGSMVAVVVAAVAQGMLPGLADRAVKGIITGTPEGKEL